MTVEAIADWYRALGTRSGPPSHLRKMGEKRELAPGVDADWWGLYERDGTRLAQVLRTDGRRPLVRQVLPNPLTIARYRMIRDGVTNAGGIVLSVPRNVLQVADIIESSIEVVAVEKPSSIRELFRADQQLIKAHVQYRTGYTWDSWSGQRSKYAQRETYFLSGYDQNEEGLSYFFCELPPFKEGEEPKTVADAYESLKPESVKIAEKLGRKVLRQGDMFFIRDKKFKPEEDQVLTDRRFLHNSNHAVDESVIQEKLHYVRGTVTHRPPWRDPDHKPLKLGTKHWWLCVRNTVPVTHQG